jgi:hypothetical protein
MLPAALSAFQPRKPYLNFNSHSHPHADADTHRHPHTPTRRRTHTHPNAHTHPDAHTHTHPDAHTYTHSVCWQQMFHISQDQDRWGGNRDCLIYIMVPPQNALCSGLYHSISLFLPKTILPSPSYTVFTPYFRHNKALDNVDLSLFWRHYTSGKKNTEPIITLSHTPTSVSRLDNAEPSETVADACVCCAHACVDVNKID